MSRMCREKGAVKHDDRVDCLAQGVKYFTDAMAISANEQMKLQKREDWNDMMEAWRDDPEAAANHMVFNFDLRHNENTPDNSKVRPQSSTGFSAYVVRTLAVATAPFPYPSLRLRCGPMRDVYREREGWTPSL